jgi:hypothetical protein
MCDTKQPEIKLPEIKQLVFDHRKLFDTFSKCNYDLLFNSDNETAKYQMDATRSMVEAYAIPDKMKRFLKNGDTAIITPDIMEQLESLEAVEDKTYAIVIILKDNNIWAIISSDDINY